jgi:hypothetical protein
MGENKQYVHFKDGDIRIRQRQGVNISEHGQMIWEQ